MGTKATCSWTPPSTRPSLYTRLMKGSTPRSSSCISCWLHFLVSCSLVPSTCCLVLLVVVNPLGRRSKQELVEESTTTISPGNTSRRPPRPGNETNSSVDFYPTTPNRSQQHETSLKEEEISSRVCVLYCSQWMFDLDPAFQCDRLLGLLPLPLGYHGNNTPFL